MNDAPVSDLLRQASIMNENHLMNFFILVENMFQTLEEVQEHTLNFTNLVQFTMAHMYQGQLLNEVQKLSTIQHALQEWL